MLPLCTFVPPIPWFVLNFPSRNKGVKFWGCGNNAPYPAIREYFDWASWPYSLCLPSILCMGSWGYVSPLSRDTNLILKLHWFEHRFCTFVHRVPSLVHSSQGAVNTNMIASYLAIWTYANINCWWPFVQLVPSRVHSSLLVSSQEAANTNMVDFYLVIWT